MAYVCPFPADGIVLVREMTLCQTLAAHGGTPCARAVKAGLALLPPELPPPLPPLDLPLICGAI